MAELLPLHCNLPRIEKLSSSIQQNIKQSVKYTHINETERFNKDNAGCCIFFVKDYT